MCELLSQTGFAGRRLAGVLCAETPTSCIAAFRQSGTSAPNPDPSSRHLCMPFRPVLLDRLLACVSIEIDQLMALVQICACTHTGLRFGTAQNGSSSLGKFAHPAAPEFLRRSWIVGGAGLGLSQSPTLDLLQKCCRTRIWQSVSESACVRIQHVHGV